MDDRIVSQLELPGLEDSSDQQRELAVAMKSWATLQPALMALSDLPTIEWMMLYEQATKNRIRILDRLYSRWNKLRQEVDRVNLSKGILPF